MVIAKTLAVIALAAAGMSATSMWLNPTPDVEKQAAKLAVWQAEVAQAEFDAGPVFGM